MKRYIVYLTLLALGTAAAGCSDDDTAKNSRPGPTTVESISIRTRMAEISRAASDADDPTMGPAEARAGHTMSVTLGSDGDRMQARYKYNGGKWVPEGNAVVFPDNKRQPVGITLVKEGTVVQDGTAQGLVDADQLGWDNPAQVPLREMANVPVRHLKTLVEFELGTIAATALTVDGIKAYHVANGNKWQAIIEPETPRFTVAVTVNGSVSTTEISAASSPTDGMFLADYRYTVPLVLNGSELALGTIGVGRWAEGAGGTAQGMTPTHYRIEGLENRTIEVYLAGSDSPTEIALDGRGEAMEQAGVPIGIIARIACDGEQYEIGREESSQISLRIVGGKVAFRDADGNGAIPVNTIAELKMIDLDDAGRGNKYLQQGNIDLLDAEWTPISKLNGTYDGGNFTVSRLRVSLGNGNAGLFAANAGTIRNVVIASASALKGQWHAGMVCGENTGTIEKCTNRASVTDGGNNTLGGICGYNNNGTVSECVNTGTLTIDATVPSDGTGGIVGYCGKGSIKGCGNAGGIGGKPSKTGGIAGQADGCQIADCYNTGDLVLPWGAGDNNGGIAGLTYNTTLITRCYNTGTVTVEGSQAGGICGQLNGGATISSCYNAGKVGAKWNSGGIAGQSTDAEIIACHNDGLVECQTSGWAGAGGICGFHKGTITACYHIGQVKGDSAIGAIVGEHNSGSISYCYWNGDPDGIPVGGGGSQTGNAKFGAAWPEPSAHPAWRTTSDTPDAYWRTLGNAGGGYPKLAWEK